jgi:hypothetical protein
VGATRRPLLLLLLDEIVYSPVSSVDSAKAVLQIRTRVLNEDWEDTFRGRPVLNDARYTVRVAR